MPDGWSGEWKWTETPEFAQDCDELHVDPGEVDWLRVEIGEWLCEDPLKRSNPVYQEDDPRYEPDVRYFRTVDAPAFSEMDAKLVIFRIEAEPQGGDSPRELTGLALWDDEEA